MSTTTLTTTGYTIDSAHSAVRFLVRHLMISKVHGQLSGVTGIIHFDAARPEATTAQVTITVSTINTGQEQRDGHLKSADFFDIERFPNITFESKSVIKTDDFEYDVIGDLTMHGVTKQIELKAELTPEVKAPDGSYKIGVSAKGVINREDFGMTYNAVLETGGVMVGKEIQLEIDAELERTV